MSGWDRTYRGSRRLRGLGLIALAALGVLVAACGGGSASGTNGANGANGTPFAPPTGWHDITPPTSEPVASYAVSPDVPGLIVACIGDQTAHTSAAPMGPAHIWRTRDGGDQWQRLAVNDFYAGCSVALPAGGHGTIVAGNFLGPGKNPPQFIEVSHDAGDTWHMAADTQNGAIQPLFNLLAQGVYRDGRLYTTGQINPNNPGGAASVRFSATSDGGRTWTAIESAPDPLLSQHFTVPAIAADQRAPGAWFRVLGRDEGWFAQPGIAGTQAGVHPVAEPSAMLEHSSDGGKTWTVLRSIGPAGTTNRLAYTGPGALSLATQAATPGRVCAAFDAVVGPSAPSVPTALGGPVRTAAAGAVFGRAMHLSGPPYIPPSLTALAASDDGGQTWSGAPVVQHMHNGGGGVEPGVAMDTAGTCYVADNAIAANPDPQAQVPLVNATIWRLASGEQTPRQAAAESGAAIETFGVTQAPGSSAPRLVALIAAPQPPVICGPNSCPPETPHPPHLVWTSGE